MNLEQDITVLVADDIPANRKMLQRLLSIRGYSVIEASGGIEAVELFDEKSPDVVLMDINMPDMDGHEATARIKQSAGDHYVPVIFVTALSSKEALRDALASGGDDFISKPVDMDVLESKMGAHLRIRDMNKQIQEKNAQLIKYNAELQREHEIVNHFFDKALKQSNFDTGCIKYHMSGMSAFNGDILMAEVTPQGNLVMLAGDFTGHGLSAAMGTLPVAQVFFDTVRAGRTLEGLSEKINKHLNALMPTGMFLTACIAELSVDGRYLKLWAGGLPDIYWLSASGDLKDIIKSWNLPLGIVGQDSFDSTTRTLEVEEGDQFYFYTDGVTEANNLDGEMFGDERLKEFLVQNKVNRLDALVAHLREYEGGSVQDDDTTIVELTCMPVKHRAVV